MKLSIKNITVAAIFAAFSLFTCAQSVSGASTNVLVGSGGDHFSPTNVLISVNDSVVWSWVGSGHSTTSGTNGVSGDDNGAPSGSWDTGIQNVGFSFTNKFTSAGTFSYYCSRHFNVGMTGQVFVVSSGVPPTLAITNPLPGAVFAALANVTIQPGITNGSGTVTNVAFYTNSVLAGSVTASPFNFTANNLAAGAYALTAAATALGTSATSAPVNISVVTPVTTALTKSGKSSGTNFQFSYSANVGLNYVVERAANVASPGWIPLVTNVAASNPVVFVDLNPTNNQNYYRVGRLPNP